jgi:ligand-binding SRPBCC domain-containing protein
MGLGKARIDYQSRVDVIRPYTYFREVMTARGIFLYYEHDHYFARMDDGTRVRNEIRFATKLGTLGRPLELTLLRTCLMQMLARRNARLKRIAESNEWQNYLEVKPAEAEPMSKPLERLTIQEPPSPLNMQKFA